ncbi:MAG: DUF5335 domain-containing protein [Rhodospirillaceae bacterium]|nr:DUF5335 domain-containing protein [Rhodospirillaceae bacterium]
MPTRKLERPQWQKYFDHVSKHLGASTVEIQVAGLDLGVQSAAEHLPLGGISYDPGDNTITVSSEDLEHRISAPREVYAQEEGGQLRCLEIIDSDDHKQLVQLKGALALPPFEA